MPDIFHGSRRLPAEGPGAQHRDPLNTLGVPPRRGGKSRISAQRRRWIELVAVVNAIVPMWHSRRLWIAQVKTWVYSEPGLAACAELHIRPEVVVRIAIALARFADGATGRNCAAANATIAAIAGCSASLVTRVRNKLLAPAGLAVEAHRGSGGGGRPNRASVWHLVPSSTVAQPAVSDLPTLPPGGGLSPVRDQSPRARKRAEKSTRGSAQRRRRQAPRPLAVQKLAAGLIARSVGLERVHPGQVCDALSGSGLDLAHWSPAQLAAALDADMRQRGISWPDRITRPGAFLAARLRRLPARPALADHTPAPPRQEPRTARPVTASSTVRRAALDQIRSQVAAAAAVWRPRMQTV